MINTNKRRIFFLVVAILLVLFFAVGTFFVIKTIDAGNSAKNRAVVSEKTADTIKNQAVEALMNNNKTTAKTLFQKAQQQYKDLGNTNGEVDTAAQIYLIDHPGTN